MLVCVVTLLAPMAGTAQATEGEPPPYSDSGMSFPEIRGPEGPEEYSWRVSISEEQELRQIDERTAGVFYPEGVEAFAIEAAAAHDALGATVPTTLVVSEGDVITLIVHHREGNPAPGGAPFTYPVVAGPGWEGGYRTTSVPMAEPALASTPGSAPVPTPEPFVMPCRQPRTEELRPFVEPKSCVLVGTTGRLNLLSFVLRRLEWSGWGTPVARAKGVSEELLGKHLPIRVLLSEPASCAGELRYEMARVKPSGERWRRIRLAPCPA